MLSLRSPRREEPRHDEVLSTHTHVPTVTLALMYCFLAHTKNENAQDTFFPSKHTNHTSPAETIIPVTERTISAGHIVTRLKSAAIEGRIALNLASVMKRRPGTHRRVRETTFTIYTPSQSAQTPAEKNLLSPLAQKDLFSSICTSFCFRIYFLRG